MALRKRCLGVDLGSHTIKVAELVLDRSGARIEKIVSGPTGVGSAATPAERQAAIAKSLRDLLKANKISTREAVFSLPGNLAFVRRFRLPATSEERLERIIRYEARQQIPFPLEKTQIEFQSFPSAETGEVEIVLVAVRNDQIADFITLIGKTGLTPVSISLTPFALFNFHSCQAQQFDQLLGVEKKKEKKKPEKKKKKKKGEPDTPEVPEEEQPAEEAEAGFSGMEEVRAYVHFGASSVDLAIGKLGKVPLLGFVRSVPTAGNDMTKAVQDKCQLASFEEAERVKIDSSRVLTFDFDPELGGAELNKVACQAVTGSLDRMIGDLRRSLDFYISQPDGLAVDSILVSGGQASLQGFPEYIEEKLGLTVSRVGAPTAQWLTAPGASGDPQLASYAVAVGLGFQGIGLSRLSIDFLPRERKIVRDFPYKKAAAMLVILLGIIGVASQAGGKYTENYKEARSKIEDVITKRTKEDKEVREAQESRTQLKVLYEDLAPALTVRDYWLQFLANLQEVKPSEVLIDTLLLDKNGAVTIIGICETQNIAADFTKRLQETIKNPETKPELSEINETEYPGFDRRVFRFTITLKVADKKIRMLPKDQELPRAAPAPGPGRPSGPAPGGMNPYAGGNFK